MFLRMLLGSFFFFSARDYGDAQFCPSIDQCIVGLVSREVRVEGRIVRVLSKDRFQLADGTGLLEVRMRKDPLSLEPSHDDYVLVTGQLSVNSYGSTILDASFESVAAERLRSRYDRLVAMNLHEEPHARDSIQILNSAGVEHSDVSIKGRVLYYDAQAQLAWVQDRGGRMPVRLQTAPTSLIGRRFYARGTAYKGEGGRLILYPRTTEVLPERSGMLSSLLLQ